MLVSMYGAYLRCKNATCVQGKIYTIHPSVYINASSDVCYNFSGGITTLIDMPLNSEPSTVSVDTLKLKVRLCCLFLIYNIEACFRFHALTSLHSFTSLQNCDIKFFFGVYSSNIDYCN